MKSFPKNKYEYLRFSRSKKNPKRKMLRFISNGFIALTVYNVF